MNKVLETIDKDNSKSNLEKLEIIKQMYNELNHNKSVIANIDKDFFFEFIDMLISIIDNSISKEVIENKKNQMLEEYKEVIKTNSTKAFIMKCQIEFAEELLEGK